MCAPIPQNRRNTFLLVAFFFLNVLASCHSPRSSYSEELDKLLPGDAYSMLKIDSVKAEVFEKNIYQFEYFFRLKRDTSSADGIYFIPLMATDHALKFLKYPSVQPSYSAAEDSDVIIDKLVSYSGRWYSAPWDWDTELISVQSRDDLYYYILSLTELQHLNSSRYDSLVNENIVHLKFLIKTEGKSDVNIPLGKVSQKTAITISTNPKYNLNSSEIALSNNTQEEEIGLAELPKELTTGRKLYAAQSRFSENSIIGLNLGVSKPFIFWRILAAYLIVLLVLMPNVNLIRRVMFDREWRDTLSWLAKKEFQTLSALKSFYDKTKAKDEEEMTLKSDERIDVLLQLTRLRQSYEKERRRGYSALIIAFVVIMAVMFFLQFSALAQAPKSKVTPLTSSPILEDVLIKLKPSFTDDGTLRLQASYEFLVSTVNEDTTAEDVFIYMRHEKDELDHDGVYGNPKDRTTAKPEAEGKRYKITVRSKAKKVITPADLKLMLISTLDSKEIKSNREGEGDYTILEIGVPYKQYNYIDTINYSINPGGFNLHRFPFDRYRIDIPLSFKHETFLNDVTIARIPLFSAEPDYNYKLKFQERPREFVLDHIQRIHKDEEINVQIILSRPILLIVSLFLTVIAFLTINGLSISRNRVVSGVFANWASGIAFVGYGAVSKTYFDSIPNFTRLDGSFNYFDLSVLFCIPIFIIFALIRRKRGIDK